MRNWPFFRAGLWLFSRLGYYLLVVPVVFALFGIPVAWFLSSFVRTISIDSTAFAVIVAFAILIRAWWNRGAYNRAAKRAYHRRHSVDSAQAQGFDRPL